MEGEMKKKKKKPKIDKKKKKIGWIMEIEDKNIKQKKLCYFFFL